MTNTLIAISNGKFHHVDDNTSPVRGPLRAAPKLASFESFNPNNPIFTLSSSFNPPTWFSVAEAADENTTSISTGPAIVVAASSTPEKQVVASSVDPAEGASVTTSNARADSSSAESAIFEFRERLRWLNKVTAAATEELDAIAPPPMKSALEGAVKAAQETDIGPAIGVAKRVVGDLQEGFSGLLSAAKDFDAGATTAELKARMEKEIESRKENAAPPTTATETPPSSTK